MFLSLLAAIPFVFGASVVAQSNPTVLCVAGQCIQGYSNVTAGAVLSGSGISTSVRLLPGQYTSSTSPELLHSLLTSSSPSISFSPGFANANSSSFSLPLNLVLESGLSIYPGANYSGPSTFTALPSNNASRDSTSTAAGSVLLSSNVWAAVSSGPSAVDRLVLWDSIADLSQLPLGSSMSSLSILDIQSSACSPPCSSAGICSASGTCTCPPGFNGTSCESCTPGFFGPNCQACPAGCLTCDDGITGSGRCLVPATNSSASCNCLNGVCESNGQCTCNAGWTTATNGTACAKCADGFFLTSDGDCQVCGLGCTQCADGTGICSCKQGFTLDANDRTQCIQVQPLPPSGIPCPDPSFNNGTGCAPCSSQCTTCNGPTSSDCIICGPGLFTLSGNCVGTDANGVCQGSNLIANNNKRECDSCPAKCTSCKLPNFSIASTLNQAQCTGCLPGFVLSQGQCVESCPLGTFLSPQDNLTCTACDSSCSSCTGSSTFCLSCANNQLASNGKCVSSCPANAFSSSGTCITCHPDCASCSGASFNQCASCPPDRPVLTNGRCLPTCGQSQFFDKTSSTCQSCDQSCSSCSGTGPSNCLSCSSSSQILQGGTCVKTTCSGSTSVVSGLGICLSDLVELPQASGTKSLPPLPTITGINSPAPTTSTPARASSGSRSLTWWEILLMALGCAFIFMVILMLWRRRMRRKRAKATAAFASAKKLNHGGWKWRLVRFGERLFGHKRSRLAYPPDDEQIRMEKLRAAEEARYTDRDMDKLLDSYNYSRAGSSRGPSPLPSLHENERSQQRTRLAPQHTGNATMTERSMYSQVTGLPRRGPEARQPVRNARDLLPSRFSTTSYATSTHSDPRDLSPPSYDVTDMARPPTPAQEYARLVSQGLTPNQGHAEPRGTYWLQPTNTGNSRNPFRQ